MIKHGITYEKTPLKLSCNATNGNWKFCRWAKGEDISCTFSYDFIPSRDDWTVRKCEGTDDKHCEKCDRDFEDFLPTKQLKTSVAGDSNTLCEIQKLNSEMIVDDGEYVCELLKCATPEDGGCDTTPDHFQKYDILQTDLNKSIKVQVYLNYDLK